MGTGSVTQVRRLFRLTSDDIYCNTSYPISPDFFSAYRAVECDIMAGVDSPAFYIHVPFCRSLCRFCE